MNKSLELFYKFLEANDALIGWEQNYLVNQTEHGKPKSRAEFFHLNIDEPDDWIIGAFHWSGTPQDHKYWYDLNNKWNNHLSQNT